MPIRNGTKHWIWVEHCMQCLIPTFKLTNNQKQKKKKEEGKEEKEEKGKENDKKYHLLSSESFNELSSNRKAAFIIMSAVNLQIIIINENIQNIQRNQQIII